MIWIMHCQGCDSRLCARCLNRRNR
jgi:hypothetical protein